jgi:hypothetical protein
MANEIKNTGKSAAVVTSTKGNASNVETQKAGTAMQAQEKQPPVATAAGAAIMDEAAKKKAAKEQEKAAKLAEKAKREEGRTKCSHCGRVLPKAKAAAEMTAEEKATALKLMKRQFEKFGVSMTDEQLEKMVLEAHAKKMAGSSEAPSA